MFYRGQLGPYGDTVELTYGRTHLPCSLMSVRAVGCLYILFSSTHLKKERDRERTSKTVMTVDAELDILWGFLALWRLG